MGVRFWALSSIYMCVCVNKKFGSVPSQKMRKFSASESESLSLSKRRCNIYIYIYIYIMLNNYRQAGRGTL
jgi:hypothetical protein